MERGGRDDARDIVIPHRLPHWHGIGRQAGGAHHDFEIGHRDHGFYFQGARTGQICGLSSGRVSVGVSQPQLAVSLEMASKAPATRGSGQAFAYNFGKSFGAFSVAAVGLIATHISLGTSIALVSLGCYTLSIIATLLLPETRRLILTAEGLPDHMLSSNLTENYATMGGDGVDSARV
jgi:hypothetical protein